MTDRAVLLREYLYGHRGRALRPGKHDCALFAAGWVKACSGRDLAADWVGRYGSFEEGQALLEGAGHADHVDLAAHHLEELPGWMAARVGDIAVMEEAGHLAFGIVGGAYVHVLGLRGLDILPLSRAIRLFRP